MTERETSSTAGGIAVARQNRIRTIVAALLLVLGLLLPWNVTSGIGSSGSAPILVYLLVVAVTLLSLAALAADRFGGGNQLRLRLNIPYFVVVLGFLVYAVVQMVRDGGTTAVPPGIGPGAWLGLAGAVTAAQPAITDAADEAHYGSRLCARIGLASLVLGILASLATLYWRTRFVIPNIGTSDVAAPNLATAVAAVLYSIVAVIPIVIVARWLRTDHRDDRLATVLLGGSILVAGLFVWVLPVGRDLDAFHGIAQSTGTAGVGYEGYLAWAAAAAIIGTATIRGAITGDTAVHWRGAVRKCLILVLAWCGGTAVLRIADVALSALLDLPAPPFNGTALMAFDLIVAALALWLFINFVGPAAHGRLMLLLFVALFAFSIARVAVGVVLVPRQQPLNTNPLADVFGNTLVQQITSTFDVALCVLTAVILAVAVWFTGWRPKRVRRKVRRVRPAVATAAPAQAAPLIARGPSTSAAVAAPLLAKPKPKLAKPERALPKSAPSPAAKPAPSAKPAPAAEPKSAADRIAQSLVESTGRFEAQEDDGQR